MSINRAAIMTQLLQQLQTSLSHSAQVSLLNLPTSPEAKPQVVLTLGQETMANEDNEPPSFGRKLTLNVTTQISNDSPLTLLQTLDALAESIELALANQDSDSLWMGISVQNSDFSFAPTGQALGATMVQQFELSYLVLREDICTAPQVNEVYLSNQGGPYELVATLPTNQ